jgi:hypothetical protein
MASYVLGSTESQINKLNHFKDKPNQFRALGGDAPLMPVITSNEKKVEVPKEIEAFIS